MVMKKCVLLFIVIAFVQNVSGQVKDYFIPPVKNVRFSSRTLGNNGDILMSIKRNVNIIKINDSIYEFKEVQESHFKDDQDDWQTTNTSKYLVTKNFIKVFYWYYDGVSNLIGSDGTKNLKILKNKNQTWVEKDGKSIKTYSSEYLPYYDSFHGSYDSVIKITIKTNNEATFKDNQDGFRHEIDYYYYAKGVGLIKHEGGAIINNNEVIKNYEDLIDDFSKYSYLKRKRDLSKFNPDFKNYEIQEKYNPLLKNKGLHEFKVVAKYDWIDKKSEIGKEIISIDLFDKYQNLIISMPDFTWSIQDQYAWPQVYQKEENYSIENIRRANYTQYNFPIIANNPKWMIPYTNVSIEERNNRETITLSDDREVSYDIAIHFECNDETYATYYCILANKRGN